MFEESDKEAEGIEIHACMLGFSVVWIRVIGIIYYLSILFQGYLFGMIQCLE